MLCTMARNADHKTAFQFRAICTFPQFRPSISLPRRLSQFVRQTTAKRRKKFPSLVNTRVLFFSPSYFFRSENRGKGFFLASVSCKPPPSVQQTRRDIWGKESVPQLPGLRQYYPWVCGVQAVVEHAVRTWPAAVLHFRNIQPRVREKPFMDLF